MLQVSDATKEAFKDYGSHKSVTITINQGTATEVLTNSRILQESVSLEEILEANENLTFTGCNASIFKFSCGHIDTLELKDAQVTASIKANNTESVPLFVGFIDSAVNNSNVQNTMDIVAYDILHKINDIDYRTWYDSLDFDDPEDPMTILKFRNAFFAYVGITQVSVTLPLDELVLSKTYEDDILKGETIIKAICQINGRFGKINRLGQFDYVDIKADPLLPALDLYPANNLFPGYSVDEEDLDIGLYDASSLRIENYDVVPIESIQIADKEGHIIATAGVDTPINIFTLDNNFLSWGHSDEVLEDIAEAIYNELCNYGYTPLTVSSTGLPYLESGDYISITTKKGVYYTFILHRVMQGIHALMDNYEAEGDQYQPEFEPNLDDALRKAVDDARRETERQLTNYDVAVQEMNNIAIHAMGAYQDSEESELGGRYFYISNYPIRKEDGLCYFNENATVFRTSGQDLLVTDEIVQGRPVNWKNGYNAQTGKLIVNMLYTIGLEADWIVTGLLKDVNYDPDHPYDSNFWNLDDGSFSLRATTKVGGRTVQQIAEGTASAARTEAESYADAIVNSAKTDLQNQIDGNITSWFEDYAPTMSNYPVTEWAQATEPVTEYKKHMGDLFYDGSTGYCYRFQVKTTAPSDPDQWTVNDFEWVQISDEDIAKALAAAKDAQDTADAKRRVFYNDPNAQTDNHPTPAYDVGDLWVQGVNGDILRCVIAKEEGQSYAAIDWVKASKYTDDSALTSWISGTYAPDKINLQDQIDKRAETWYQATDPSINWTDEDINGITIVFNSQCDTEDVYDYIDIYYKDSATTYAYIREDGSFGGQAINIPANKFWVYWHTDVSVTKWGWKIDSITKYEGSSFTTPTATGTNLPNYTPTTKTLSTLESAHPYTGDIDELYVVPLRFSHEGDLWYRTTDDTTWYYMGTEWVQQNVPTAVFDKIDGKAQIFTSQPVPPYFEGDLWFASTTSAIKVCIHSNTVWDPDDWVKRDNYVNDSDVTANVIAKITDYDTNTLTQTRVYNKLTNNSNNEGVYLSNGHLYINASMINTGILTANLIGAGTLLADIIHGGTLTLGGTDDFNGELTVLGNNTTLNSSSNVSSAVQYLGYSQTGTLGRFVITANLTNLPSDVILYYEVYLTTDGQTFTQVDSGSFIPDASSKIHTYPTVFDINTTSGNRYYYISIYSDSASHKFNVTFSYSQIVAQINSAGLEAIEGKIADMYIEDRELYTLGEYFLGYKGYTGRITKKVLVKFKPSTLNFAGPFYVTVEYALSDVLAFSGTYFLTLEYLSGGSWVVSDTQPVDTSLDNHTLVFSTQISNTDTKTWRVRTKFTDLTVNAEFRSWSFIRDVKTLSISDSICQGSFRGRFTGSGEFDTTTSIGNIEFNTSNIYIDDSDAYFDVSTSGFKSAESSSKYVELTTTPSIKSYNSSSKYINISASHVKTCSTSNVYIDIATDPYIEVYQSSDEYINITHSMLRLQLNSTNFCKFSRLVLEAKYSGETYYINWQQGSDERIKEEIEPLDVELSKNLIDATEPKKFKYKSGGGKHYGMIAQEAREVLDSLGENDAVLEYHPDIENENITDYRALRYEEYIPHLINYVKELRAELYEVKAELAELKAKK